MKYLEPGSEEAVKLHSAIQKAYETKSDPDLKKTIRKLRAYIRLNYTGDYARDLLHGLPVSIRISSKKTDV